MAILPDGCAILHGGEPFRIGDVVLLLSDVAPRYATIADLYDRKVGGRWQTRVVAGGIDFRVSRTGRVMGPRANASAVALYIAGGRHA